MDFPPSSPSFATDNSSKKRVTSAEERSGRDGGGSSRRGVKFTPSKEPVSSKYGTPSLPPSRASQRLDESGKLQDQIGLQHLVELMRVFNEANEKGRGDGGLDIEEFQAALGQILGVENIEEQMALLFMKIDSTNDGTIDWDEFCTYMLLEYKERDLMMGDKLPPFPYDLKNLPSTVSAYRAPISRITFMPNIGRGDGVCSCTPETERDGAILTVNRDGLLCFWKSSMVLQKTVNLDCSQSKKTWVTDMAVMPNIHKLVLGFTNNILSVYDLSTPAFDKLFQITGLYHCPLVLYHWYDEKDHNHSVLVFGDTGGGLCMMEFTRATRTLFGIATAGELKCNVISFEQVVHHKLSDMKSIYFRQVHCDWINHLIYWPGADSIISCCSHSNCSLIINSVTGRRENVVFKVRKGIAKFDFCPSWNIIATGGIDRIVRVWNPYVATKPISVLRGHHAGIIHVIINPCEGHILSFSKDLELRIWDIRDQLCLQVCHKFHILGQHIPYGFYFHTTTRTLLIANNHLWSLQQYIEDSATSTEVTTHDKPLCGALYSENFNLVVSASHDSVVSVWDLETGEKTIQFSKCHGEVEITAMALDPCGRRLVTGGRDGSVKMWNFNDGACLSSFKSLCSTEVTCICFLKHKIIASGWNRRLSIYRDVQEPDDLTPNYCGEKVHSDDILCMAHQAPNLLATASYDGDIVIWNSDVEQVVSHLNNTTGTKGARQYRLHNLLLSTRKKNGTQKQLSGPACIKGACTDARFGYNDNTAVEQVIFLPNREQNTTSATLVAAGAGGMIQFWNIYGSGLLGQFNVFTIAAETKLTWKKDEEDMKALHAITALKVDSVSSILISGTSLGYLQIWDISDYCVSVSESTPLYEAPPDVLCWRAHITTIVSIDLAEDKALIITASTDCCVRLWTMQGRYIGTFGERQLWKLCYPIVSADLPRKIPPSLHKSASFKTMQTVAGPCKTKWSLARDLFKVLRRNRLRSKKQRKNGDQFTDPDFDDLSSSEILGDAYRRKSRVRQPLELTKLQLCDGYPVGIYASLKCSELQDCEESHSQLLAQLQVQDPIDESCSESEDEEEHGKIEYDPQLKKPHTERSLFPEIESDSQTCIN